MKQNNETLNRSSLSLILSALLVAGLFHGCDNKTQSTSETEPVIQKATEQKIVVQETVEPATAAKKIVARVNDVPLYADKLNALVQKQLHKDKRFSTVGSHPAQRNLIEQKILKKMINDEVLRQASLKESVANLEEKIEKEHQYIKNNFGSDEKLKHYIASMKMNDAQFINFLKEKVHLKEYFKKYGLDNPEIPEAKLQAFYDNGKKNFRREALVQVSQILLPLEKGSDAKTIQETLDKANALRDKLLQGEDFATLARQYSQSREANESNGSLGFIKKGYMPSSFETVAFSLDKDEISKPVLTQFGYHIIKVTDKLPERIAPYEEVKEFIRKYLQEREIVQNTLAHIKKLRDKADIEIIRTSKTSNP